MGIENLHNPLTLVLDCETNGLAINPYCRYTEVDNWPRIAEFAWVVVNGQWEEVLTENTLIKPEGWTIPKTAFFVDNGMSTERCAAEGKPIRQVMDRFLNILSKVNRVVIYNVAFDKPVVFAELLRLGMPIPKDTEFYCAKLGATDILKLPGRKPGEYQWPKLSAAFRYFKGHDFDGAHGALADVRATVEVYKSILTYNEMQDLFG